MTEDIESFETWDERCSAIYPQFRYWNLTLNLQLLILIFIRSQRDGNFQLCIEALYQLIQYFFAFDQTNYARWVHFHIRDLSTLAQVHPNVDMHFRDENFVIHKTARMSSAMSIYQGHEQNNALVNGT